MKSKHFNNCVLATCIGTYCVWHMVISINFLKKYIVACMRMPIFYT